jgi:hypothetical protein
VDGGGTRCIYVHLTNPPDLKTLWAMLCFLVQVTGEPVGEVRAVSGMHERKAEMARFADAFIALPGMHYAACTAERDLVTQWGKKDSEFLTHARSDSRQVAMELWKSCWRSSPGRN